MSDRRLERILGYDESFRNDMRFLCSDYTWMPRLMEKYDMPQARLDQYRRIYQQYFSGSYK